MALLEPGNYYDVAENERFGAFWRLGVAEGWINPMTDAVVLQAIKDTLSRVPGAGAHIPGEPENVRTIRFPRSARYEMGRIEIGYQVIVDDRKVWLDRIRQVD